MGSKADRRDAGGSFSGGDSVLDTSEDRRGRTAARHLADSTSAAARLSRRTPWLDPLSVGVLLAQLVLAASLRVTAWPEVTTPGYLWSRGMLLYRDIKLQHAPATTGTLAILFLALGVHTWMIRAYAIVWPLLAQAAVLRETRKMPAATRLLASAFFLAVFFSSDGNAVWPTVVMTAMAIPIARALSFGRFERAGLILGTAILFKQTAAYALFVAVLWLLGSRRVRAAATLFLWACLPYAATLAVFTALGAGADMLRWTIVVPLTIRPVTFHVPLATGVALAAGFLPLAAEAAIEKPGEYETSARALLVVAVGLALICYPRFQVLQTVASVPCLAVGAARLMNRPSRTLSRLAVACVAAIAISRAAIVAFGHEFDGRVLFWNDDPAFNALIDRLRQMPRDTPLYSELWENVHPRAEMIPPGRIYQHPWFWFFFGVDDTGERMRRANSLPGTVIVGYRRDWPGAERIGPYAIIRR
jgi:hypothetical protein